MDAEPTDAGCHFVALVAALLAALFAAVRERSRECLEALSQAITSSKET